MDNRTKGILYIIVSSLAFSMMQICIAKTAGEIPLYEQLFFRNLVAVVFGLAGVVRAKVYLFGKKENWKLLLIRATTGYLGMICVFYATGNAGQGDVAILNKISPFLVTLLAVFILKEKITKYQVIALIIAFGGAFFVANPQFNSNAFPLFIAIVSAVFTAIAYIMLAVLKDREHPSVTIFIFSLFSTIISFIFMLKDFVVPNLTQMFWLILIGIFAGIGQICITYAYTCAKAGEVSIYSYTGIVFSIILGYLFLGETIKATSMIGASLVIIGGIIVYYGNRRIYRKKL